MKLTNLSDDARLAFENLGDFAAGFVNPTIKLGVTGLSRAGKTIFISSMVHNLINHGRMPLLSAYAEGRVSQAYLQPQPDDALPRFRYEDHIEKLLSQRVWPKSTTQINQLRVTIDYESASFLNRAIGGGRLHVDIVDYPGEWLLDLPLLGKSYEEWSREALHLAHLPGREKAAFEWLQLLDKTDLMAKADEKVAQDLSESFTRYLNSCRADDTALSMLPPGRFLMPGDLAGSPAVTFAPLPGEGAKAGRRSLWSLMERRYEAYKSKVIKPFFRDHFARLDRQIVLIDALNALNAGPAALRDLETALSEILLCFRPGHTSWLASILSRRIDRILFAATKADHLHRSQHDHLESLLTHLVKGAIERAKFHGATVDVVALAAVRATREAVFKRDGEDFHCIAGTPLAGEVLDGETFDGKTEKAIFPGTLPTTMTSLFDDTLADERPELRFIRFRPPILEKTAEGFSLSLPHIRLDRALDFLIGDKLQ